ncbi:MAG: hypothetical protein GY807_20295 [Gammaproteobacteria bacterium]|nr:hypothetical protein [Gammaproteobacteria bacterium]
MEATEFEEKTRLIKSTEKYLFEARKKKEVDSEAIWHLAKALIGKDEFGWGRRLLDMLADLELYPSGFRRKVIQKRALATYKDPDLNRNQALTSALEILDNEFDLSKTDNQETLGLAGAIYKRKWDDMSHLYWHIPEAAWPF